MTSSPLSRSNSKNLEEKKVESKHKMKIKNSFCDATQDYSLWNNIQGTRKDSKIIAVEQGVGVSK